MKLADYLERIGYGGSVVADFATLAALQEAHVFSVPFENLDVQLGRPLTTRVEEAYQKIVVNRRGGWCYEQNGLFGWALSKIGFEVTRIAANVMPDKRTTEGEASHLCLLVKSQDSTSTYLVDVGFGGSMIEPIALRESQHHQAPYALGLEKSAGRYWRFWEDYGDGRFYFDFVEESASEKSLSERCDCLQNEPSSHFVLNLVAQLRTPAAHRILRGRVFSEVKADVTTSNTLKSPEELVTTLLDEFLLDVPDIASRWPAINDRHEELFGEDIV